MAKSKNKDNNKTGPIAYAKNVVKSAKYIAVETAKGVNPTLTSYISDNASTDNTKEVVLKTNANILEVNIVFPPLLPEAEYTLLIRLVFSKVDLRLSISPLLLSYLPSRLI